MNDLYNGSSFYSEKMDAVYYRGDGMGTIVYNIPIGKRVKRVTPFRPYTMMIDSYGYPFVEFNPAIPCDKLIKIQLEDNE